MATITALGSSNEVRQFWPVRADEPFDVGDLLWWDSSNVSVRKASTFTYDTSDALTRRQFKRLFVGVSNMKHQSGDVAGLCPVIKSGELESSIASTTAAAGQLFGPYAASSLLVNQQIVKVTDPAEAIGEAIRNYSSATTTMKIQFSSILASFVAPVGARTVQIAGIAPITAADLLTNIPVENLFGGAAEVLAFGFIEGVAVSVTPIVANLENNATNLANLTVPVAGAAIGRYTEADMSADAARVFAPGSTVSIEVSTAPAATASGTFYIRFRPLS